MNPAPAVLHIASVNVPDTAHLIPKGLLLRGWEHRDTILRALAVVNVYLAAGKINILDAEPQTLAEAQTSAVHQRRHESPLAGELREYRLDLFLCHDNGQVFASPCTNDLAESSHFTTDDLAVQEQKRRESLAGFLSTEQLAHLDKQHEEERKEAEAAAGMMGGMFGAFMTSAPSRQETKDG